MARFVTLSCRLEWGDWISTTRDGAPSMPAAPIAPVRSAMTTTRSGWTTVLTPSRTSYGAVKTAPRYANVIWETSAWLNNTETV